MKRAVALMLMERGARCTAVIVIRMDNLFCRIFLSLRCRHEYAKRLSSSECQAFSLEFLRAGFRSWHVGRRPNALGPYPPSPQLRRGDLFLTAILDGPRLSSRLTAAPGEAVEWGAAAE
jgi:hypothetical protein